MVRAPCCDKGNVKRGPWSPEEDAVLRSHLERHGARGNWIALPQKAGLKRCGKSCRLRWLNYLRPDIKHGGFTEVEDNIICTLYNNIGSKWSVIASHLPGRTDNDVKNHWNTKLKKRVMAAMAAQTSSLTGLATIITPSYIQPRTNPSQQQPPCFMQVIKSETNISSGGENFFLPNPPEEALYWSFGYNNDPQRLLWELSQFPQLGFLGSSPSPYIVSPPEDGSAASSSTTTAENYNVSGTNWGTSGALADDWFMPELGFGVPVELLEGGGHQSQEPTETKKPKGVCQGVTY